MTEVMEIVVAAALVGIGGTAILDLISFLMERFFGTPAINWRMVGRWLGHMSKGQFVQRDLKQVAPVPGEHALGWVFHYLVGAGYGLLLVAISGAGWLESPWIVPLMVLVLALLVLPYFVMMPGMGMGIAASWTPKPNVARLKSVLGHSIFGCGMFLTAWLMEAVACLLRIDIAIGRSLEGRIQAHEAERNGWLICRNCELHCSAYRRLLFIGKEPRRRSVSAGQRETV